MLVLPAFEPDHGQLDGLLVDLEEQREPHANPDRGRHGQGERRGERREERDLRWQSGVDDGAHPPQA